MSVFSQLQGGSSLCELLVLRVLPHAMVLSLGEMDRSVGEMSPLLSLPAKKAQSLVLGLIRMHYFIMRNIHIFRDGQYSVLTSNMYHAYVVYLLSLATHPSWLCFRYSSMWICK